MKNPKFLQRLVSGLLFLIVICLLGWLSTQYKADIDWTYGHRNTLTQASKKQLASMVDPIKFIAFLPSGADARHDVQTTIDLYKHVKSNIDIEFVDPSAHPEKVKEYSIDSAGEVVVDYQGRRETLNSPLNESVVTGGLQKLSYTGERFVVFLEGHGERSIQGSGGDNGFAKFAQALAEKGYKTQGLNLAKTPSIPEKTSALVIAGPEAKLLDGEVAIISRYLAAGGNLLWMADPDTAIEMDGLKKSLGITWQNGFVIFPNYQELGTQSPAIFLATGYPQESPITRDLTQITAFPLVRSLTADKDSGWTSTPMLVTDPDAWLDAGKMEDGPVSFNAARGDVKGPLTIGLSLTRPIKTPTPSPETAPKDAAAKPDAAATPAAPPAPPRTQRAALIGNSAFLDDANLAALGNKQLGLNLVAWLSSSDSQLNIDIPKAPDVALYLPGWAVWLIAAGFAAGLPIALLTFGLIRWAIRRRA